MPKQWIGGPEKKCSSKNKEEWLIVVEVGKSPGIIRIELVIWDLAMIISLLNLHFILIFLKIPSNFCKEKRKFVRDFLKYQGPF